MRLKKEEVITRGQKTMKNQNTGKIVFVDTAIRILTGIVFKRVIVS